MFTQPTSNSLYTIILLRHAESTGNVAGYYQGQSDFPLSPTGIQQANALAQASSETISEQYQPVPGIGGRVTIAGSDTMQPLMAKLAASFMAFQPPPLVLRLEPKRNSFSPYYIVYY